MRTIKRRKRAGYDYAGRKFGRLTVLRRVGEKVYTRKTVPIWRCRCECGRIVDVLIESLRNGKTRSCGCLYRETRVEFEDLVGRRFGRLTVLAYAGKHGKQRPQPHHWRCLCDCGNERIVRGTSLTSGHATSCGCLQREVTRKRATTHGQSHTREYLAMKCRERLERKRHLDAEWTLEMDQLLRQLQPSCVVCGDDENLTVDHVHPMSQGHGLRPGNAVILCGPCNSKKWSKTLDELPTRVANRIEKAAKAFANAWQTRN